MEIIFYGCCCGLCAFNFFSMAVAYWIIESETLKFMNSGLFSVFFLMASTFFCVIYNVHNICCLCNI